MTMPRSRSIGMDKDPAFHMLNQTSHAFSTMNRFFLKTHDLILSPKMKDISENEEIKEKSIYESNTTSEAETKNRHESKIFNVQDLLSFTTSEEIEEKTQMIKTLDDTLAKLKKKVISPLKSKSLDEYMPPGSPKEHRLIRRHSVRRQSSIILPSTTDLALTSLNPAESLDFSEDELDVISGNPKDLVAYATSVQADFKKEKSNFIPCFLATYSMIMSHSEVIEMLITKYNYFKETYSKVTKITDSILKKLIKEIPVYEIDMKLVELLSSFDLDLSLQEDLELHQILCGKILEVKQLLTVYHKFANSKCTDITVHSLSDFRPADIAKQITLNETTKFKNIQPMELLNWMKYPDYRLSPNLKIYIDNFNDTSYWVQYQLLKLGSDKERHEFGQKLIKVLKALRKLNNFSSYMCILSALDSTSITRLNWKNSFRSDMAVLTRLMDTSNSFQNYREALKNASPPCIPYVGMMLQDLTFTDIGNKSEPANPDHSVNFAKNKMYFSILEKFKEAKDGLDKYQFKHNMELCELLKDIENHPGSVGLRELSDNIRPVSMNPRRTSIA